MPKYSNSDGGDVQIFESGGVHLKVGAIVDGQYMKRNGSIIDSAAVGAGGDVSGPGGAVVQDVIVSWDVAAASPYTVNETDLLHISDAATYSGLQTTLANGDLVLGQNGTGAVYLGPPADGTAVGGNARGTDAVDFCLERANAVEVASGQLSGLFAGRWNRALGFTSVVVGGVNCIANGNQAIVAGGYDCDATANQAGTLAGETNVASGVRASCVGGKSNTASGQSTTVVGGENNAASGTVSGVFAAIISTTTQQGAVVLGGYGNAVVGTYSGILSGFNNGVTSTHGAVVGGYYCRTTANYAATLGGIRTQADHPGTVAFSGNSTANAITASWGESQGQLVHLDQATTDATPATLDSIGTELAVPANTVFSITGTCVAWNETDTCATKWNLDLLVYESAGALVFVSGSGAQAIIATDEPLAPGTVPTLSIGSTGTNINFNITGIAAKTMRWSCTLVLARAA